MRISDWSSDVCSSDLRSRLLLRGRRILLTVAVIDIEFIRPQAGIPLDGIDLAAENRQLLVLLHFQGVGIDVDRLIGVSVLVEADLRIGRPADNTSYNQGGQNTTHAGSAPLHVRENRGLHAADELYAAKIGRASCRERASQNGSISVAAESVKQQK